MSKEKVLDITDEASILEESQKYLHGLNAGIQALALDFGFHIKNSFFNGKIYTLRDNISYRLDSSFFHLHLLFKELKEIISKHNSIDYGSGVSNSPVLHLEFDKRHLTYILDSIIFHLSSVFDYSAILINYILSKTDKTPSWNSLENSARNNSNIFTTGKADEIKQSVLDIHNNFVRNLYDYRSEIMHRNSDLINGSYAWEVNTNKKTLLFLCSPMQIKSFKNLGDSSNQFTITYFSHYLILQTIESIGNIIRVLKNYMELNSQSHELLKEEKLTIAYADPDSKELLSPGTMYWPVFYNVFHHQ